MRKLTHHRRKTLLPAVTIVIFCPAKQRLSGETFAQNTLCPAKRQSTGRFVIFGYNRVD